MPAGGGSSIKGGLSLLLYAERKEMQSVVIYFWICARVRETRTRTEYHADVAPCGAFPYLNMANKRVICRC